jgi:2-iminobutanoate/2-iminopropanoate deaminase
MKKEIIHTPDAPSSPLFSQAVKIGATIHVSGTSGLDPRTQRMSGTTIQEQTRQALRSCEAILAAAGARRDDVVEVQVLLARADDFAGMNEEYATFFPTQAPARSVSRLGVEVPDLLVSIKMIAVVGSGSP